MKKELDDKLCEKYPLIFSGRHKSMMESSMCWGFECGDGWYNIIDQLCANIQHHIDYAENDHSNDIEYNNMIIAAQAGDYSPITKYYENFDHPEKFIESAVSRGLCEVRDSIPQVVATQVKEKFGGLRFYYDGGDDVIDGMVRMAESMSYVICELCGESGRLRGPGWLSTLCDKHAVDKGYNIDDNNQEDYYT